MSDFEKAYTFTLTNEVYHIDGKLIATYHDKYTGEFSFMGISQVFLEQIKYPKQIPTDLALWEVHDLYLEYFWNWFNLEEIQSQTIASKCFDLFVNMGPSAAIVIQHAINDCGPPNFIKVDGILGLKSFNAINLLNPGKLLDAIIKQSTLKYQSIAYGANTKNLPAWLDRAKKVPS